MKQYINYADKIFKKHQDFALRMAFKRGNFDSVHGYSKRDIDKDFYKENQHILSQPRGGGYWLWKPYFINKSLRKLCDGDYLFYSDSGAFFLKKVDVLIEELEQSNQDIMGFELPLIENQWTKKELLINMNCNKDKYINSNQLLASYILIKKSNFSVKFFQEYLTYSCNEINISDKYDENIDQDSDFIEHRHDQSIFSLLYKRYNFKSFKDPSQLGKYPKLYGGSFENDLKYERVYMLNSGRKFRHYRYGEKYENILFHCREAKPLKSFLKFRIRCSLYKLGFTKLCGNAKYFFHVF